MDHQKITLYKVRDFGEKINATVEYIRYNIGALIKLILLIVAPVGLLIGILYSKTFSAIPHMGDTRNMTDMQAFSMMEDLGINYLLMILLSTFTGAFMISAIYMYMKLNDEGKEKPTVSMVYNRIFSKIPMIILLIILSGIVSVIGFVCFIIPGIYLMITLSLATPIYMFEEVTIGQAFSKSFELIKGKWWSTFGLLFITGLIASITSYVFAIPMYAMMIGSVFSTISEGGGNDPEAIMNIFSSWYTAAGMAFMVIGSYITYLIPLIALSFQYFNLSERVEGRGIRNQIEGFETVA